MIRTDRAPDNQPQPKLELFEELYQLYGHDLADTRDFIKSTLRSQVVNGLEPMKTQFDDLESECLYLLARHTKPKNATEISPNHGYSTMWILRAMQENGSGSLTSFDLHDESQEYVPDELKEFWELAVGDVRKKEEEIPPSIDFLLMDSKHTMSFASWYLEHVIHRVIPGSPVVIHDIESRFRHLPFTEAAIVKKTLRAQRIGYMSLSSYTKNGADAARKLEAYRPQGFDERIAGSNVNPSIFSFAK